MGGSARGLGGTTKASSPNCPADLKGVIPFPGQQLMFGSLILLHIQLLLSVIDVKPGEDVIRESRMRGSLKGYHGE